MAAKRYYWLKLNANFFEREEIKVIEMQPNGEKYINFYFKLLLKSLYTNGRLMFRDIMPYTPEILSKVTNTDVDTVKVAIDMFVKFGMMDKLDDGALFMKEIENMTGSETEWASKKRLQRQNADNLDLKLATEEDNVQEVSQFSEDIKGQCPIRDRDKSKEIRDKSIEIDKEIRDKKSSIVFSNLDIFKHFEKCGFIVTSQLMEFISADIEVFSPEWMIEAANEALKRGKLNNYKYVTGILQNWLSEGRDKHESNSKNSRDYGEQLREDGIGFSIEDLQ